MAALPINVLKFIVIRDYLRDLFLRAEFARPGEAPKYRSKPMNERGIIVTIIIMYSNR